MLSQESILTLHRKHNNRVHNRPTCDLFGCTQSFGSKGDLDRHKKNKHNQLPLHKRFRCPEQGCKHALTPRFKRKDHLTNHLKNMHNHQHADAKAKADLQAKFQSRSQSISQPTSQIIPHPTSQAISRPMSVLPPTTKRSFEQELTSHWIETARPEPSKRRRLGASTSYRGEALLAPNVLIDEVQDEVEIRSIEAGQFSEIEALQTQNVSLRTENESLRAEVERLKKNEDALIAALVNRKP